MLAASPHRTATDAETGLWLTERLGGAGATYHMPLPVRLRGPLDPARLAAACDAVVARHPALASRFAERDGAPVRLGAPAPRLAVGGDPDTVVRRPFDLTTGPLSRFALLELGPDEHLLLVVAHHLVFDGMSKDILLHDLAAAYRGETLKSPGGGSVSRPPSEHNPAAEAFWKERDARLDEIVLFGRTIAAPARPEAAGSVPVDLSRAAVAAERSGVSRFEATLAALHAVLRAHGNPHVAVAVDVSTRDHATAHTVGLFVNELPVSAGAPAGSADTFRALGERLRQEMRAQRPFRRIPYARAVGGRRPRAALAPVSLSYRRRAATPSFGGLVAAVEWAPFVGMVRGAVHLQVVEGPDGVEAHLRHNTRLLDPAGARALADALSDLLATAADDPETPLAADVQPVAATARPVAATADPRDTDDALTRHVRRIWQEVLKRPHIGLDDDLYDLGGHSLVITQIAARIRKELGDDVSFEVFLDQPTVRGVVDAIRAGR